MSEIGAFMAELRKQENIGARALEFVILTAARTGEVIGARWEELDVDGRTWTVPASRTKTGREHRVPLSAAAVAVVEQMRKVAQNDFVFPGANRDQPISDMRMFDLLRRMDRADLTVHGFRSTFRDWAAEQTAFPNEVVEMALGHIVAGKVEAAYRRGDLFEKRRKLMEAWASYCASAREGGTGRADAAGERVDFRIDGDRACSRHGAAPHRRFPVDHPAGARAELADAMISSRRVLELLGSSRPRRNGNVWRRAG